MAKSKYETHVEPYLNVIKAWARNGATDEEICRNLGIGKSAFYDYQNKHVEFSLALKTSKDIADMEVEHALYDEAVNGRNITAMIFWLKNRKPKQWKEKPVDETANNADIDKLCEVIKEATKQ